MKPETIARRAAEEAELMAIKVELPIYNKKHRPNTVVVNGRPVRPNPQADPQPKPTIVVDNDGRSWTLI